MGSDEGDANMQRRLDSLAVTYTPREGDVIENPQALLRLQIAGQGDGTVYAHMLRRDDGKWVHDTAVPPMTVQTWHTLVNHMGWRLLPRVDNAT